LTPLAAARSDFLTRGKNLCGFFPMPRLESTAILFTRLTPWCSDPAAITRLTPWCSVPVSSAPPDSEHQRVSVVTSWALSTVPKKLGLREAPA